MGTIDEGLLDDKLAILEGVRSWSPRLLAKLEALVHAPDDHALVRVNPISFARDRGITTNEALDLFLHTARVGMFTMDWHLLCPRCGAAVESFASLRALHNHFYCAMCLSHSVANLDDYIQVSFTIAPAIRRLKFHDPDSLSAEDYLYKLRFTPEMHLGGLDGPRLLDLIPELMRVLTWIEGGARLDVGFDVSPGFFSATEFQAHTGLACDVVDDGDAPTHVDFVIGESTLEASVPRVRAGRVTATITNRRTSRAVFAVAHKEARFIENAPDSVLAPIVTGAMLLTNQTFRRLFRGETLQGSEGIGVRDVTVLFTDLKGSTALYERIGDLKAFTLVQQHFERLSAVVQANGGAVIKTIGDAVMAAFQTPADAVRAAFEMRTQIERFNREHGASDIVLKIGIHRGPSIAVTLNDSLDYFGHTVNVAARVQGLAGADEIYVTDDVLRARDVDGLARSAAAQDAQLRGLQKEVRVHKLVSA